MAPEPSRVSIHSCRRPGTTAPADNLACRPIPAGASRLVFVRFRHRPQALARSGSCPHRIEGGDPIVSAEQRSLQRTTAAEILGNGGSADGFWKDRNVNDWTASHAARRVRVDLFQ